MRIALIADTHGTLDPRIAGAVRGSDILVHAGDVGPALDDALGDLAERVCIVQGNNDPEGRWPLSAWLDLPGGGLAVIHGDRWPARTRHRKLREAFPSARAIVCGHSHRRLIEDAQYPWVLNPGAAGRSRAYGGPGYIELEAGSCAWRARAHSYEPLARRGARG